MHIDITMTNQANLTDLTTTAATMVQVLEANYMSVCRAHGADSAKAVAARDTLYSWELVLQACRADRAEKYVVREVLGLINETVKFHR